MSGENTGKIIIPTLAHQMLKSAVDVIAKTAGLGIVTGRRASAKPLHLMPLQMICAAKAFKLSSSPSALKLRGLLGPFAKR